MVKVDAEGYAALAQRVRELEEQLVRCQRIAQKANLLEHVADAIVSSDLNWVITGWDGAAEAIYRWRAEEVLGRPTSAVLQTEYAVGDREEAARQLLQEGQWRGEVVQRRKDGSRVPILAYVSLLKDAAGNVVGAVAVNRDITQFKQAQEALKQRNRELDILNRLGVALAQTLDLAQICHLAHEHVSQLVDCPYLGISLYDPQSCTLRAEFMLCDGQALDVASLPPLPIGAGPLRGRSRAILTGQPEVVQDLPAAAAQSNGPVLRVGNGRVTLSAAYVPMLVQGQVVGLLEVQSYRLNAYGEAEVALLRPLANQIGLAIQNARLFEQVRSHAAQLEQRVEELRRAQQALAEGERRFRLLYEEAPVAYQSLDEEGRLLEVNRQWLALLGYDREEVIGRPFADLVAAEHRKRFRESFSRFKARGEVHGAELELVRKDGSHLLASFDGRIARDEGGRFRQTHCIVQDITERRRAQEEKEKLQAQLFQAQKMEAVGLLAGGIAHDFNNLLTVILGNAELALTEMHEAQVGYKELSVIHNTAQRAAALTQQMLAFGRRRLLQPQVLDLNALIADLHKMLSHLIGEHIEVRLELAPEAPPVLADPSALEQVLMNLSVNARDAMPQGGTLTIATREVTLDEASAQAHPEGGPGTWLCISVQDTGIGMDETVRSHLFEPFFTTKEVGKGTGLGLAVVYGIVKQHNGWIEVYSRPGQGARFDLYLPVQQVVAPELLEVKPAPARAAGGSETILLAEDEEPVRALVCAALENLGYTVLACANGQEAVDTFAADAERIDLLILDAVMPKLSGQAAYEAISALRPDVPVLFISGYSEELGSSAFALKPDLHLLYKPFAVAELGRKVREVLDRGLAKRAY